MAKGGGSMAYNDLKDFGGQKYMGMPVGGRHTWNYLKGIWMEEKVTPESWVFRFDCMKKRTSPAPDNSGAPIDTQYHWYILADQRVRKIDKDSYDTMTEGVKYKISHKRPHWRKWSSEYPNNITSKEKIVRILEDMLERLRDDPQHSYRNAATTYMQL